MGIDIPAGATADDVDPRDYQATELSSQGIARAVVYRPDSIGIDLPAGRSAAELTPTDYRVVEIRSERRS